MRQKLLIPLGLCLLLVAACGPSSDKQANDHGSTDSGASDANKLGSQPISPNGDATDPAESAQDSAIEELQDQTYEDVMGSDDCIEDCSGHNAGWEWAKDNRVLNPDDCSGNSDSFIDGCKAYGEEVERRAAADDDSGGDSN